MDYLETIKEISDTRKIFEGQLEERLGLIKVPCPLFVKVSTGLQDQLSGTEKAVGFEKGEEEFEIVHSLAKWKREALGKYAFPMHSGLYTDMKAIRKDEKVDDLHSLYVEQWDWERVIDEKDRSVTYLMETVNDIYECIKQTAMLLKEKYSCITLKLPKAVFFITSQELEDMYPDKLPKEREEIIVKDKGAVCIIGIGDKLKSGIEHDLRSPDYDDWKINADLLIYDEKFSRVIEVTSMGVRVDEKSLRDQLEKSGCMDRLDKPYHQKILKKELPYTIGGGIGQSRILMLLLGKEHIAQVQSSSWEKRIYDELEKRKISML